RAVWSVAHAEPEPARRRRRRSARWERARGPRIQTSCDRFRFAARRQPQAHTAYEGWSSGTAIRDGPPLRAMKLLVTGGVRSGKTRYALHRAEAAAPQQIYVATGRAGDDEMQARIARHQRERGPTWTTVETPLALATTLAALPSDRAVLVDCLTLWLSNLLLACPDDDLDAEFGAL